jgi:branched-chain amino acid transport system ATP-binding protein
MSAVLQVSGLSVSYGGMSALSDVDLVVPEGTVVALLGTNGAGKTTTLRTLSGLVKPDRGSIRICGRDVTGAPSHTIAALGLCHVPEGRGIFRSLTVAENLSMATYAAGGKTTSLVDQAVELFPVLGERLQQQAGTLSGGEQQMLALARALVMRPRLLLLDEISMGLAPLITAQLFDRIRQTKLGGTSMLIVEQYVDAALELADYGYVLEKGRIVDMGEPADLKASEALAEAYLGAGA